jgi:TonB family protein
MARFAHERRHCGVPIGVAAVQHSTIDASRSATSVSVSLLLSVAFHAGLLALALVGPTTEPRLTTSAREVGEHLEYALTFPLPTPPEPTPNVAPHVAPKRRGMPAIVLPKLDQDLPFTTDLLVPTPVVPDLPVAVLIDTIFPGEVSGESAPHLETVGDPSGLAATSVASSEPTASAYDVDAIPLPENPKPVYPPGALRRNIEQSFVVEFVVDTTGRVDARSIVISPSVPREFAESVTHAIVKWHFRPAQLHGFAIRRSVRQPFIFQIAGPNT